jgi:hypothetical protein
VLGRLPAHLRWHRHRNSKSLTTSVQLSPIAPLHVVDAGW